jgi:hypothetical protein
MLLKSKISKMPPHSAEWFNARIGRLTGSKMGLLCKEKGIGKEGLSYIRKKAAEKVEGKNFDLPIDTFATDWGRNNEPLAIEEFKKWLEEKLGRKVILIKPSVIEYDELYSCTPDFCVITNEKLITDSNDTGYFVESGETKCFQLDAHLRLLECDTPEKLKEAFPDCYWQCIAEAEFTGSTTHWFVAFHPELQGGMRLHVIEFRKVLLRNDFKLFNDRRELARPIYNEKVTYFSNLKNRTNVRSNSTAA